MSIGPYVLLLPDVALEKIFSFLTYDEIAKNREVCKKFNDVGGKLLSRGFLLTEKRHSNVHKRMKALLPRRESERRVHPLARHCDILSALETRISMLNMTFTKYIEAGLCCFIPGKVIDEIEKILRVVEMAIPPPRTHEILQELRDISSMAMEHFDECILPGLKMRIEQPSMIPLLPPVASKSSKFVLVQCSLADEVKKVKKQGKHQKVQMLHFTAQMEKLNRRVKRHHLRLKVQSVKIRDQERKLHEQSMKIQEQEATIADLRKHMDEWEQRFSDLTVEVRARDDFIAKTPSTSPASLPQPAKMFHLPNIKPRKAQVLPKPLPIIPIELERKRKCTSPFDIPTKLARSPTVKQQHISITPKEINLQNIGEPKEISAKTFIHKDNKDADKRGLILRKTDLGTFISNSIETLIKNPLTSIKSRKRKMAEDIDMN